MCNQVVYRHQNVVWGDDVCQWLVSAVRPIKDRYERQSLRSSADESERSGDESDDRYSPNDDDEESDDPNDDDEDAHPFLRSSEDDE